MHNVGGCQGSSPPICDLGATFPGLPSCSSLGFPTGNGPFTCLTVSFTIPAGCNMTVNGQISIRPSGCSSSGVDGSSASDDRLRVTGSAGVGPFQTGGGNSTQTVTRTQTGGTIVLEGCTNRRDEIMSYTFTCNSGCTLPIELLSFNVAHVDGKLYTSWITASETNNAYFLLSVSNNKDELVLQETKPGSGNSSIARNYEHILPVPFDSRQVYVELANVDLDGTLNVYRKIEIQLVQEPEIQILPNPTSGSIDLHLNNLIPESKLIASVISLDGRIVAFANCTVSDLPAMISNQTEHLPSGVYVVDIQGSEIHKQLRVVKF
jgi:hypothetical protein